MSFQSKYRINCQSRGSTLLVVCALFLNVCSGFATQPVQFSYQAKLTDSTGAPLQGSHGLFVSIWSPGGVNTPNGGVERYAETTTVTAVNGVINHVVGTGDHSAFGVPLDDAIMNRDSEITLQIAVDSSLNIVLPRTRLQSVPFAIAARSADSAGNGVPAGYQIFGPSPTAPAGFTPTGSVLYTNWVARPPLVTGTSAQGAASVGGKVFAVGGTQGGITSVNHYEYDPATNTWSNKAPMFSSRRQLTYTELNGLLYAVGGYTPNGGDGALSQNEVYYPATDTWGTSHALTTERSFHAAAAANGKLYVFGGFDDSVTKLATVEEFDPSSNTWTFKSPMSSGRYGAAAASVDNKIYVVGGETDDGTTSTNEQYDPLTDSWAAKAPLPFANSEMSAVSFGGKIYVIGGLLAAAGDTWIYDPVSDTWTLGPPLAAYRAAMGACVANGRIFAVGGVETDVSYSTRVEELPAGIYYVHAKD